MQTPVGLACQMVAHLETEVCPAGTRVWPVQNDGWLAACINCGAAGKIKISMSKTDYIVLTQGAWDDLHGLTKEGIQITGHHLTDKLPQVIALYEVRCAHWTAIVWSFGQCALTTHPRAGMPCQFMCNPVCTTASPATYTVMLTIACHICSGQDNNVPEEGTGQGRAPGGMSPHAVLQCMAAAQQTALLTHL